MERLDDRCKRICGDTKEDCFIKNREQLSCIADMVLNKVSGVCAFIESAAAENRDIKNAAFFDEALKNIHELVNWIKFLQISSDLRTLRSMIYETRDPEARRETRYPVPEIYQKFISMKVGGSDSLMTVTLSNFSRQGLQFNCPEPLETGSLKEVRLLTSPASAHEVALKVSIRYCNKNDGGYTVGGRIEESPDGVIIDFFKNVHDLILDKITAGQG